MRGAQGVCVCVSVCVHSGGGGILVLTTMSFWESACKHPYVCATVDADYQPDVCRGRIRRGLR
eukprot:COSAG01_NODE_35_length_34814_cov_128.883624_7_plen_63_part_00